MISVLGGIIAAVFVGNKPDNRGGQSPKNTNHLNRNDRGTKKIEENTPDCPLCGSGMVSRVARKGRYQGQEFFGCSKFPRCKGIVSKRGEN
jgi:ssDNA-binding Zn-finger/Zn-ribbon topoisomerase 1